MSESDIAINDERGELDDGEDLYEDDEIIPDVSDVIDVQTEIPETPDVPDIQADPTPDYLDRLDVIEALSSAGAFSDIGINSYGVQYYRDGLP